MVAKSVLPGISGALQQFYWEGFGVIYSRISLPSIHKAPLLIGWSHSSYKRMLLSEALTLISAKLHSCGSSMYVMFELTWHNCLSCVNLGKEGMLSQVFNSCFEPLTSIQ